MTGEVVFLFAFDVADEIQTARIRDILSRKPLPLEIRVEHTFPRDLPLYKPLGVDLPPLAVPFRNQPVQVSIRVYEVGVLTIALRTAFTVAHLLDLMPFHQSTLDDGQKLDRVALELCREVCVGLRPHMVRSTQPSEAEAYTVFCLTAIDQVQDVNRWLADERRTIAGLLTETSPDRLSEAQINEVLRIQRSFENTDLTVIDWDAALLVDLSGYVEDVLYVLELANLQLEEFRVMDQRLDLYLNQYYDDLERKRWPLFGVSSALLRTLRRFRIDVTKLADEVTHITKFFGDWYLARVYLAVRDRFYLDQWRQSVERRLAQLDQLYSVVHAEVYEKRMLWLEIIIVVLFAIDLFGLFFLKR